MRNTMRPRASRFEPLPDIPMDKSFTLEQLTGRFQSVRDGVPELVKNSKDHYSRLGILEKGDRQIVVVVSQDMRGLGVLDFGGANETDFEGWQKWSSREAGRADLGSDIEAGYGNGGKAFMVRGSVNESYMCGYSNGMVTKMGFQNDDPALRYHPGWYLDENGRPIKSLSASDMENELNRELQQFGTSVKDLPPSAQRTLRERKAFTIVVVDGVKDWSGSRARDALIRRLPFDLANHPQAALTIETCSVWVMRGKTLLLANVLENELPDPLPGFEEPVLIPVPDTLRDMRTKENVSTGPGDKFIEIRTSRKPLRLGEKRALNVIRVRNERNVVANWPVAELAPMASSTFIFGTLRVPALIGEHLVGAERQALTDTPLTRALRDWVEKELVDIATQIQRSQASRDTPEDRDATNEALRKLRDLMRQFLRPEGGRDGAHEFGSIVHEIVLEPGKTELTVPTGTVVPLVFKCYERDKDRRLPILKPTVHMVADPVGVVRFNGFSSVTTLGSGTCKIRLENLEGTVRSNEITISSRPVQKAGITGPDRQLKQGEIVQLDIRTQDSDGNPVNDAVYEISLDEMDLGRVGRTGVFTGGATEGTVTIRLKYGPESESVATCSVVVGPEKVERQAPLRADVPLLLLCGTVAPGREDLPEAQRTHPAGPQYPTIIDFDPQWESIVWINLESAEAQKVRGSRGPIGAMGIRTQTVFQFLALKGFEVLRRLKVKQDYEDKQVTSAEFLRGMSEAEIDAAPFLDSAYAVVERMLKGVELEAV